MMIRHSPTGEQRTSSAVSLYPLPLLLLSIVVITTTTSTSAQNLDEYQYGLLYLPQNDNDNNSNNNDNSNNNSNNNDNNIDHPPVPHPTPIIVKSGCIDTPNWIDSFGDDCSYYSSSAICRSEGVEGDAGMGVAVDNCCSCGSIGGGMNDALVTSTSSSTTSTTMMTTTTTSTATTTSTTMMPATSTPTESVITSKPTTEPIATPTESPTTTSPTSPPSTSPPSSSTSPPPSTSPPTSKNYSAITPDHTSFCGPKIVGGYSIAKSSCSHLTECGHRGSNAGQTAYGSTGNDCPRGSMCYTGIACVPPTGMPSGSPSGIPTESGVPSSLSSSSSSFRPSSGVGSGRPSGSGMPSDGDGGGGGGDPTTVVVSASRVPTVLRGTPSTPTMPTTPTTTVTTTTTTTTTMTTTTSPYNAKDTITARGSYCGSSFVTALRTCEPIRSCHDDGDCIQDGKDGNGLEKEERCFDNISCTFHASKSLIAGVGTEKEGDDDDDDDDGNDGVKFAAANDFQGNGSTTRSTHVGAGRVGGTTTLILVLFAGVIFLV